MSSAGSSGRNELCFLCFLLFNRLRGSTMGAILEQEATKETEVSAPDIRVH